jgi:hypothetical protein
VSAPAATPPPSSPCTARVSWDYQHHLRRAAHARQAAPVFPETPPPIGIVRKAWMARSVCLRDGGPILAGRGRPPIGAPSAR